MIEFKEKFYLLSLDLDEPVTICIKAERDIQIQDKYGKVFVYKHNYLKIMPAGENNIQVWGISGDKSVELDIRFSDFPFYKSAKAIDTGENKVLFSASKISLLKEFITGLFMEKSPNYCWVSALDGNSISVDFGDQVAVSANDPVTLSRFLNKILDWAQIPIVVSSVQFDKESFRRSLRFWAGELIKKSDWSPIQVELLQIKNDEGGDIDYFDQEFLDELKGLSKGESSVFSRGFIECKIQQVVHEYFRTSGAQQQDIDKIVELVMGLKNPDVELIDSIVFNTTNFS
jgi:hypothetical protein